MNKVILLLSGTPEGKTKFIEVAKTLSWVKNVSFKTQLGVYTQGLYDGERDENYDNFIYRLRELTNRYFNSEQRYLEKNIEKFIFDGDGQKTLPDGRKFDTALLILHGVSKNLFDMLKAEHGVFVINISRRSFNSSETFTDRILYDDDENYEEQIIHLITVLTESRE